MSDGECQRIMIARALAQDTPVVLLDEPTAFWICPTATNFACCLKSWHKKRENVFSSPRTTWTLLCLSATLSC